MARRTKQECAVLSGPHHQLSTNVAITVVSTLPPQVPNNVVHQEIQQQVMGRANPTPSGLNLLHLVGLSFKCLLKSEQDSEVHKKDSNLTVSLCPDPPSAGPRVLQPAGRPALSGHGNCRDPEDVPTSFQVRPQPPPIPSGPLEHHSLGLSLVFSLPPPVLSQVLLEGGI